MIIENKDKAQKIKLIFLSVPILIAITVIAFVLLNIAWGLWVVIPVAVVGTIILIVLSQMRYFYIRAEINPGKINFKFFQITPFYTEYQAYDIRSEQLDSYVITKKFLGFVPILTLYIKTPKGKARYPSLSLSAYSKDQRKLLEQALNTILKSNNPLNH